VSSARSRLSFNTGVQLKVELTAILLASVLIASILVAFPGTVLAADATFTGLAGHIRSVVSDGTDVPAVNTDNGHIYKYDGVLWTDHGASPRLVSTGTPGTGYTPVPLLAISMSMRAARRGHGWAVCLMGVSTASRPTPTQSTATPIDHRSARLTADAHQRLEIERRHC